MESVQTSSLLPSPTWQSGLLVICSVMCNDSGTISINLTKWNPNFNAFQNRTTGIFNNGKTDRRGCTSTTNRDRETSISKKLEREFLLLALFFRDTQFIARQDGKITDIKRVWNVDPRFIVFHVIVLRLLLTRPERDTTMGINFSMKS